MERELIAVIGLGYVGLPLAVALGRRRRVIGFDISERRVAELQAGHDSTLEVETEELERAVGLEFTTDPGPLRTAQVFIVTVPTPIDSSRRPDLGPLVRASEMIGAALKPGDLVIYESTVYPGATEEICVPVLERVSGLRYLSDASGSPGEGAAEPPAHGSEAGTVASLRGGFYCGYSPERINPGDKEHRIETICKVTSGSTLDAAERVDAIYREIITAGTHKASSIRVAEAAKVIENTQRDVNIALVNELALIFNRLGIDTEEVLVAAGTKWNFLPFRPGLVGGHCIGVDPYYLTHKAQQIGYDPAMILAGRRINDGMGAYVAGQLVKAMLKRRIQVDGSRVLVMGLTFKENCPDLRNTRVVDILTELAEYGVNVDVCDPWASEEEAMNEYGVGLLREPLSCHYDGIVVAVAHQQFREMGAQRLRTLGKPRHVLYDVKHLFPVNASDLRL